MATPPNQVEQKGTIGQGTDKWHYSSKTGFDLSRSEDDSKRKGSSLMTIQTSKHPILIDPAISALIIIDMQNFFLSPAFGRTEGAGHRAVNSLAQHAIPAARRANMRIIWLNWGMSDKDLADQPPGVRRAFGFELDSGEACNKHGAPSKLRGLGSECGMVTDPISGEEIDAGRLLTRDTWNSALFPPLDELYREGLELKVRPDRWFHKNRMSGMWGAKTTCEEFLEEQGIKTLFFAGVNTDQCVGGTLADSFNKGYDCVLLSDGCGTTSPDFAQKCYLFNAENTFGFQTSCTAFAEGVQRMKHL